MALSRIHGVAAVDVLRQRDFRWFFFSSSLSDLGFTLRLVAMSWLVLDITGSAAWVGVVLGARAVPSVLLSLFGGAIVDRVSKKRVIMAGRMSFALLAFLVGFLVSRGEVEAWHLLGISILIGAIFAFSRPAGPAWLPAMVPRGSLVSANSLLGAAGNTGEILGPALGGWVIGNGGADAAFYVVGGLFIASFLVIGPIKDNSMPGPHRRRSIIIDIVEGVRYARGSQVILGILMINSTALFAATLDVMLPVYARDELGVGAEGFGYMGAAMGSGFLAGSIAMSAMSSLPRRALVIWGGAMMWDFTTIGFAFSSSFPLSLVLLVIIGAGGSIYWISMMSLLQSATADNMRGRVMSIFDVSNDCVPLGAMLAGFLAVAVNNWFPLLLGGLTAQMIVLIVFVTNPEFRRA